MRHPFCFLQGKKFLAMLLTLGRDFMHLCRIAIYDMMMNEKVTDFLDPLAEVQFEC